MKTPRYAVPDTAPVYVKNWLKHCPSRAQLWTLVVLSTIAALAVAWVERGKAGALVGLVFLWAALWAFLAVRWGESHKIFPRDEP